MQMKLVLNKKMKLGLGVAILTPALYSIIGFWLVPKIALTIANKELTKFAVVPASIERIKFNPFSLELSLIGFKASEAEKKQLGFETLYVNLQIDSLWKRCLHLKSVTLTKADVELFFNKNGQLNLTQLIKLPKSDKADTEKKDTKEKNDRLFPVEIEQIVISNSRIHLQDEKPSSAVDTAFEIDKLEINHFSTAQNNVSEINLLAKGGHPDNKGSKRSQISAQATLSIAPVNISGQLKIADMPLITFWPYVAEKIPFELEKGNATVTSHFKLELAERLQLELNDSSLKLSDLALQSKEKQPLLTLAKLNLSKIDFNLEKQSVTVGKIRSQQLETSVSREADGQLNWQKLFPANPQAKDSAAPQPESPWQFVLKDTQLRNYQIHLADLTSKDPVKLDIGPLNLDVAEANNKNTQPIKLKLDAGIGEHGQFQTEGEIQLNPVSAKLNTRSKDIDLRLAQAYITPFIQLELRSGHFSNELAIDLASINPLTLIVTGQVAIDDLHTLDTLKNRDFLMWQHVQLDGIRYQHGSKLDIDNVSLNQPYVRFIIADDHSTNIHDMLVTKNVPTDAETQTKAETATPAASPLAIHIGGIHINDGSATFADFSLSPNFATTIQQLNGNISALDNQQPTSTDVDIKGNVDRYAPVTIKGKLTPFSPMKKLDIAAAFKHVELTTLSPYSGKFAGYRIRKGKLNLDLHYQIENSNLKAENKLVLEQLQLGEKVDSPDAVDLPVRLAVSLLKNSEGKIAMDVPIQGNLNNPQFKVGPLLWQTARNLVLKAVKAPFSLIANLVEGSGNTDLSSVPFAPGSEQLDVTAKNALDTLSKALQQRPGLVLEIEGKSAQRLDGPPLALARLQRELQKAYFQVLRGRNATPPAHPAELTVLEQEKTTLLENLYRSRLKQTPPDDWVKLDTPSHNAKLSQAVLDSWSQSEPLLRQLAQQRAGNIKRYLVEQGKIDEQRLYLVDVGLTDAKSDKQVTSALHLNSE